MSHIGEVSTSTPEEDALAEFDGTTWNVESLRLTAFAHEPRIEEAIGWWHSAVNDEPDVIQQQPKAGTAQLETRLGNGRLLLAVQRMRIDWQLTALYDIDTSGNFAVLGDFESSRVYFAQLMTDFLNALEFDSLPRLAFAGVLLSQVDDRTSGYERLKPLLPSVTINSSDSTDFAYQINRPRPSALDISNLQINRLSKWSVASLLSGAVSVDGAPTPMRSISYACRLEFDVNTAPEYSAGIPKSAFVPILNELIALAVEISVSGDKP